MNIEKYNCRDLYEHPEEYLDFLLIPGYLIYLFTNTVNGKHYVGDTKVHLMQRLFMSEDKWHSWGHFICYENTECNAHLYNAMRKYGLENFTLEVIYKGEYIETLEGDFIKKYDSYHNGYNNNETGKYSSKLRGTLFGRIAVTNGEIDRWIKPESIDYYKSLGYYEGFSERKLEILRENLDKTRTPESRAKAVATARANGSYTNMAWNSYESLMKSFTTMIEKYGALMAPCHTPEAELRKVESEKANHNGLMAFHTPEVREKVYRTKMELGQYDCHQMHTPEVRAKIDATKKSNGTYEKQITRLAEPDIRAKASETQKHTKHVLLNNNTGYHIITNRSYSMLKKYPELQDLGLLEEFTGELNIEPHYGKDQLFDYQLPDGRIAQRTRKGAKKSMHHRNEVWIELGPHTDND